MDDMKIQTIIIIYLFVPSLLIIGCFEKPFFEPYHEVGKKDVKINDIWIWFVIEWKSNSNIGSFVLIPTLLLKNGSLLEPQIENSEEHSNDGSVVIGDGSNFSIVNTDHGKALKYMIPRSNFFQNGGQNRTEFRVPYVLGDAGIVFNTWDEMNVNDRFFEDGPGFSIWENKRGKVTTWTYIDMEVNWIRLYLERRRDMDDDHSWGVFDCYRGITYEPKGSGWFNIELERRTSFPLD